MTFTRDDKTMLGYPPEAIATNLASLDVDAVGINCSGGPAQVLRLISVVRKLAPEMPISASPNAGWPEQMQGGRVMYPATPDYFGDYARAFVNAGVNLIGGCCGTTAAHIKAMRQAIDTPVTHRWQCLKFASSAGRRRRSSPETSRLVWRSTSPATRLILTVEMDPPKGVAAGAASGRGKNASRGWGDISQYRR
jgi:hypothetical protein